MIGLGVGARYRQPDWAALPHLGSVGVALVVGAGVRLFWLDRLSFWLDEAGSIAIARQSLGAIIGSIGDPHPPLYYLLLHYWLRVGDSEAWVRLPSALAGSLTVLVAYFLGRTLVSPRVGLVAVWLLALSPWHVWYSQEARMYAAAGLMATLSLLAGALWIRRGRFRFAAVYVLTTLAALGLDYSAFLIWPAAALGLPLLFRSNLGRRHIVIWAGLQALVVVGYGPEWLRLHTRAAAFFEADGRVALGGLDGRVLPAAAAALVLAAGLAAAWVWLRRLRPAVRQTLLQQGLVVIVLLAAIGMLVPGGMTGKRFVLVLLPLACVAGAWASDSSRWPLQRPRNLAVLSLLALAVTVATLPKQPWRDVVARIQTVAQPGDIVVITANWNTIPFDYYDRGKTARIGVTPTELDATLAGHLESYERIWLVISSAKTQDPRGEVPRWFAARYAPIESLDSYQIGVWLYRQPGR